MMPLNFPTTWRGPARRRRPRRLAEIQCQPIIVKGVLYGTTPHLSLFALRADTGEELWRFDPFKDGTPRFHVNRGVMYWENGQDQRILYTAGNQLFAVDAASGRLVDTFGNGGRVDLSEGVTGRPGRETDKLSVDATSPGVIYKDILVIGSRGYRNTGTQRLAISVHLISARESSDGLFTRCRNPANPDTIPGRKMPGNALAVPTAGLAWCWMKDGVRYTSVLVRHQWIFTGPIVQGRIYMPIA